MVTLKDIAQEAGVSVMTVSNVINGKFSKVSKENTIRIQNLIKDMGYVPNASARSLARNKTNLIAIVLRSNDNENVLESPHNSALVGTIIRKVQEHGYYAMVNILEFQDDIIKSLQAWNVDGAIFLGMFDDEIEVLHNTCNVPMVFIDSYSNIRQLSNVGIDDFKGGQLAADYLVSKGHTEIAFVSPPVRSNGVIQHRYDGFCNALKKYNLYLKPENTFILESSNHPDDIIRLGKEVAAKKEHFSAVFVTGDQMASYLIQGISSEGVLIPKEISVIGFDNLSICEQITPALTTIAQDLEEKARFSVDILFRRLNAPSAPAESLVLDVALIERDSVYAASPLS